MSVLRAATVALAFGGSVLLTRTLGAEGRGTLAALIAAASIVMPFTQGGLEWLNRRFVASHPHMLFGLIRFSLGAPLLLSLVAAPAVIGWFLVYPLAHQTSVQLAIAAVAVYLMAVAPVLNGLLLGLHRTTAFMLAAAAGKLANLVGVIGLYAIGVLNPTTALATFAVAYALQAALTFAWLPPIPSSERLSACNFVWSRRHFLLQMTLHDALSLAATFCLPLLLAAHASLAEAGYFAAALTMTDAIAKTFGMLHLYGVSRLAAASAHDERAALASSLGRISLWGMAAIASAACLAAPSVIPLLLGQSFAPAVPVFRVLCLGMLATAIGDAAKTELVSGSERWTNTAPAAIQFLAVIVTAPWLVGHFGAIGAAWSLVAGIALSAGAGHVILIRAAPHRS
ncbi:MAG: hypothetical protein R3D67_21105 [Hyphomicrobiaceae bacterium]